MNDDPGKRVGDLERQLAESNRFVAYAIPDARQTYRTLAFIVVAGLVAFGCLGAVPLAAPKILDTAYGPLAMIAMAMVAGLAVVCLLALRRLYMKKVVLLVTADGLTVEGRPGVIFPLRDARLGQWTGRLQRSGPESAGRALILTSGTDRFGIAAADRRVAGSMPIQGPQERYARLDARMSPQLFDELLEIVGRQRP